jgi:hypothetical protein
MPIQVDRQNLSKILKALDLVDSKREHGLVEAAKVVEEDLALALLVAKYRAHFKNTEEGSTVNTMVMVKMEQLGLLKS